MMKDYLIEMHEACNRCDVTALDRISREHSFDWSSEMGSQLLLNACMLHSSSMDSTGTVKYLLAQGARADRALADGRIPLLLVCKEKSPDVIEVLLQQPNLDLTVVNSWGRTALMHLCENKHVDASIVKALLTAGINVDVNARDENHITALSLACDNGAIDVVRALLQSFHTVDIALQDKYGETALMKAARKGMSEVVGTILPFMSPQCINLTDHNGNTALMMACKWLHYDSVILLLSTEGIDATSVNARGMNALAMAVASTSMRSEVSTTLIVEAIIDRFPDKLKTMSASLVSRGYSSFVVACDCGKVETARLLMRIGLAEYSDFNTALLSACGKGNLHVADFLVECGATLSCRDYDGNTCLHRASAVCDYDMIIWCLDHGVDKYAKNKLGRTALMLAAGSTVSDRRRYGSQSAPPPRKCSSTAAAAAVILLIERDCAVDVVDNIGASFWNYIACPQVHEAASKAHVSSKF